MEEGPFVEFPKKNLVILVIFSLGMPIKSPFMGKISWCVRGANNFLKPSLHTETDTFVS